MSLSKDIDDFEFIRDYILNNVDEMLIDDDMHEVHTRKGRTKKIGLLANQAGKFLLDPCINQLKT